MTKSGPQRSAIGNCEASMVATITRRLADQSTRAPRDVADQSKASTRPAISPIADTPGYSELSGNGIEQRQHPVRAQDFTTRVPGTKSRNAAAAGLVPGLAEIVPPCTRAAA